MKVLVLGSSGMLGSQVLSFLQRQSVEVVGTAHKSRDNKLVGFSVEKDNLVEVLPDISTFHYIINCIGAIPQRVTSKLDFEVNSRLPKQLRAIVNEHGSRVIQIGTDCVFSGKHGSYRESSIRDAIDDYGLSKIAGESYSQPFMNLRTSIIGYDKKAVSLQSWLLAQPKFAEVKGFQNHMWNGVTTLAFSRLVWAIISSDRFIDGTFHIVPKTIVNKFQLLSLIAMAHNRTDLQIVPTLQQDPIDKTLGTDFPTFNSALWKFAGYASVPTIDDLVKEGAQRHYEDDLTR